MNLSEDPVKKPPPEPRCVSAPRSIVNPSEDPVKKIVSKGKYAQVQGLRAGTMLCGVVLLILGVGCGVITLCLIITLLFGLCGWASIDAPEAVCLAVCAIISGAATYGLGSLSVSRMDRVQQMDTVVPLTRATAPYLPAPDTLVRASSEPVQPSDSSLLRAASEAQEQHEEQLLRPAP